MYMKHMEPGSYLGYGSRITISGHEERVRQMVEAVLGEQKQGMFSRILPVPKRLDFNEETMKPYLDFIAKACLRLYLFGGEQSAFNLDELVGSEEDYLSAHPKILLSNWNRRKDEFISGLPDVSPDSFKGFCEDTRPFSDWAALWCLNDCLGRCTDDRATFLERFKDQESEYLKIYTKRCRYSTWRDARENFRQCLDPLSAAFDQYRMNLWGAARCPVDVQVTYIHDGSATITFTTLGGPAANIVRELSARYPNLTITHDWKLVDCPNDSGCVIYHPRAEP